MRGSAEMREVRARPVQNTDLAGDYFESLTTMT